MKRMGYVFRIFMICMVLCLFTFAGCGSKDEGSALAEGMQLIEDMDYQGALNAFEKALSQKEDEKSVMRGQGIAYMGLTDYDNAIASFEGSLSHSHGIVEEMDYDLNFYLAAAYQKAGRYSEAEQIYTAILAMRPQDCDAYYLRGNARLSQELFQKAKEDFDKDISMEPANFARLIEIYEVMAAHGYKEVAEEYLQTALAEKEGKMSAMDKGKINYYLGNYEQAQVLLEEAKTKDDAEAYLYLGMAYEATEDYNYAITNVYTAYINHKQDSPEIYNQLGLCYMKQGNYEEALTAFQSAMQIAGTEMMQALQFNEIVAYEYLSEYTQAAVLLDNYIKMYPDDENAKREYDFLATR